MCTWIRSEASLYADRLHIRSCDKYWGGLCCLQRYICCLLYTLTCLVIDENEVYGKDEGADTFYIFHIWKPTSEMLKKWHALQEFLQFYLHTCTFIRKRYEPCLCLSIEVSPHLLTPGGMEGWVNLVGWLHT